MQGVERLIVAGSCAEHDKTNSDNNWITCDSVTDRKQEREFVLPASPSYVATDGVPLIFASSSSSLARSLSSARVYSVVGALCGVMIRREPLAVRMRGGVSREA